MRWSLLPLSSLVFAVACSHQPASTSLDVAAREATRCIGDSDLVKRWHCTSDLARVRVRQKRFEDAVVLFRDAEAVRGRIAFEKRPGGSTIPDSWEWGLALSKSNRPAEAKRMLEAAREMYDEGVPASAVDLALGIPPKDACNTEYRSVFGYGTDTQDYLPTEMWLALADSCTLAAAKRIFVQHAMLQAERMHETALAEKARARLP